MEELFPLIPHSPLQTRKCAVHDPNNRNMRCMRNGKQFLCMYIAFLQHELTHLLCSINLICTLIYNMHMQCDKKYWKKKYSKDERAHFMKFAVGIEKEKRVRLSRGNGKLLWIHN